MNTAALLEKIGGNFIQHAEGWRLYVSADQVRQVALAMNDGGARFSALVGVPAEEGLRLLWHWDLGGTLISMETKIRVGTPAPSIVDICPGADWAEREARDYYAVTFEGRELTPPLMLRETDNPGILLSSGRRNS